MVVVLSVTEPNKGFDSVSVVSSRTVERVLIRQLLARTPYVKKSARKKYDTYDKKMQK